MELNSSETAGTNVEKPSRISGHDWKVIGKNVAGQISEDRISIISAGVAFYFFLALFPTLIAAISIYGLAMDPAQVQQQMGQLTQMMPEQAAQMISTILERVAGEADQSLGWGMALSLLFTLWSAHQGTAALFQGVNVAYNETDERGFFKSHGLTLLFTLGGIIGGFICFALVVAFPAVIDSIPMPDFLQTLLAWIRWPLLAAAVMGAIGLVYQVAPDRPSPEFRWVVPGAVTATVLWLSASLGFSFYMNNFGNYNETYGSFTAVIVLMLWFVITAFVILLGAEINSEMERQVKRDSPV